MRAPFLLLVMALWFTVPASAQRGGFGGGGMSPGGLGMGRMPAPELPGPELEGPPDSASAQRILNLTPEQLSQYVHAYDSFMLSTRSARDSANGLLTTMRQRLERGDRAAAVFYAERAKRLAGHLEDEQEKFENLVFKFFRSDQEKAYKKWKKEQEQLAEERQRAEEMEWQESAMGLGRAGREPSEPRPEPRAGIDAPVRGLDGASDAVRVGRAIYVSGQVALDSTGRVVGEGDFRAQAARAFENLRLVLSAARARPTDVVRLTIYVVNYRPEQLAVIRDVGAVFFPSRNPPALTVVGVQSLQQDGLLIAVDAIASTETLGR